MAHRIPGKSECDTEPPSVAFPAPGESAHKMPAFSVQKKVNYVTDYLCQVYGVKERSKGHGAGRRAAEDAYSEIGDLEDPSLDFGMLSDWETTSLIVSTAVSSLVLPHPGQAADQESATSNITTGPVEEGETDESPDEDEEDEFLGTFDLRERDPSGRLTLNKISWALFARIMSVSGNDGVAATMITGKRHRLSKVPMFYACRRLSEIREI